MSQKKRTPYKGGVVAGLDIGSTTTKVVLLNSERKMLAHSVVPTGAMIKNVITRSVTECLEEANLIQDDIMYCVATGYGRELVPFAQEQVTELSCHAKGANSLYPDARTVIDVGGQDSKVISVTGQGSVAGFVMNDKCAAGTGKFLEVITRALEIRLDEMPSLAQQSKIKVDVSSVCTVFAESEVISLFSQGYEKADIAAGIYQSIGRRIKGLVNQIGVVPQVVMSGGGAKNVGLVRVLEELLHVKFIVPDDPQLIGALGAAHIAWQRFFNKAS
jgi:(R)-2-hydroxyacyl-CoA dehydratese activating ATPase